MFTFEFEPPVESDSCSCCGGRTTALTRFVYKDGDAFAIYFARFSDSHDLRVAEAVICMGEWGEGASESSRVSFPMELRATSEEYQVELIDAANSNWNGAKILGRILDRTEALVHPQVKDIFHLTDHIFAEDQILKKYLDGSLPVA